MVTYHGKEEVKPMSNQTDLTQGDVRRQLIRYSLPIIASTVMQTVYSLVDLMVVSRMLGSAGASGVSNSSQIVLMLTNIAVGLANGGNILVSQYFGSRDKARQERVTGTFLYVIYTGGCICGRRHLSAGGAHAQTHQCPGL